MSVRSRITERIFFMELPLLSQRQRTGISAVFSQQNHGAVAVEGVGIPYVAGKAHHHPDPDVLRRVFVFMNLIDL